MANYRKLATTVEAWCNAVEGGEPMPEWVTFNTIREPDGALLVRTLEGTLRASPGDYLIKGVKGEVYPCKPEIFEMTYERID